MIKSGVYFILFIFNNVLFINNTSILIKNPNMNEEETINYFESEKNFDHSNIKQIIKG